MIAPAGIPVIATERLTLRGWRTADLHPFQSLHASPHAALMWGPMTLAEAWRTMLSLAGEWLVRGFGMWALERKDNGGFIGHAGFIQPEDADEPELGWALTAAAEGRGLAQEAARAARRWGRQNGIPAPLSNIDARNHRSIRLAERLGAVLERRIEFAPDAVCLVYRHPRPEGAA